MSTPEIKLQVSLLPPDSLALTRHTVNGALLKPARHVVTEEHAEGVYVFRYSDSWGFSGDTWHANMQDALEQIEWEFGARELRWTPISAEELTALTNPGR
jgi:hypothetical protein